MLLWRHISRAISADGRLDFIYKVSGDITLSLLIDKLTDNNLCWYGIRIYLQGLRGHNSKSTDR
jgi:hypothetical protein